ncbi:MAG: thiosulfate dehydrogenase (quinone) large subunit [Actinomycetota bacterium]|nr:thiosulfate dehydrogenase (quinone) large subunit [Actinomycetota bacterium]
MGLFESWRSQPLVVRVLRVFLGGTFAYAGVQKLTDPGYLTPSSPTYIGTQLSEFARGSPIAWLLHPLMHLPVAVGVGVVVAELAIGLGTLLGVAPLTTAVGGSLTSLLLWLSATWHVHPYFLGSDSIYAVAWAALAIGIWESRPAPSAVAIASESGEPGFDRRTFIRSGVLAGTMLVVGTVAKVFGRGAFQGGAVAARQAPASASPSTSTIAGKKIANLKDLAVGKPIGFDSSDGEPSVLFKLNDTEVVAFSRVCTHAGCIVDYDGSSKLLYCPCHGAEFDPVRDAEVVTGPAVAPLPRVEVAVDGTGRVVLPSGA